MNGEARVPGKSTRLIRVAVAASIAACAAPGVATSRPAGGVASGRDSAPRSFEQAQAPASLPGGASALNETYRDWRVTCAQQGGLKRCVISQSQAQQNGQRVLAVELNAPSGNLVTGTLILPFGLALDSGIALQIDDKPSAQPLRLRTCLPGGCIVNLSFDAPMLAALRTGSTLKIKATADGGAEAPFSISLQGFATALDRIAVLSR